jgi:integrase
MERAGILYGHNEANGVTLHDLRRTLGSWQARTGASLTIIGKSLNRKSQQTTAIYAQVPYRAGRCRWWANGWHCTGKR